MYYNNQVVLNSKSFSVNQITLHHINYKNGLTTITKVDNTTKFSKEELDVIWELLKQIKTGR